MNDSYKVSMATKVPMATKVQMATKANLKVGFLYLPFYQERFSGQCDEMLRPIDFMENNMI